MHSTEALTRLSSLHAVSIKAIAAEMSRIWPVCVLDVSGLRPCLPIPVSLENLSLDKRSNSSAYFSRRPRNTCEDRSGFELRLSLNKLDNSDSAVERIISRFGAQRGANTNSRNS